MNPTFTVNVDLAKRKTSVTGLVAVGEKVDVVISGVDYSSIPEWETDNDEGFSGPALRFRIVTPDGKDLVRFPLVSGDTWNVDGTSLSAEVDFNTMQLREWLRGFSIGEKAEVGVIVDSVVDAMEYGRGMVKILQWVASPADDPTILPDWRKTLSDLNAAIVEIGSQSQAAVLAAETAISARDSALAYGKTAETAANNAVWSENAAKGFRNESESASSIAVAARQVAEAARDEAREYAKRTAMQYVRCEENGKFYRLTAVDSETGEGKVLALEQVPSDGTGENKSVVFSVNGIEADENGAVSIPLDFLPLAGGTMKGRILANGNLIAATTDSSSISIYGATDTGKGAFLRLDGKEGQHTGKFRLSASDGSATKQLVGSPTGTLVWDDKEIERVVESSFGINVPYIKYASGLTIQGGAISTAAPNTEIVVNFTKEFSLAPMVFTSTTDLCSVAVYGGTTTSFKVKHNHSSATFLRWIAIGK